MFENYRELSVNEQSKIKEIHRGVRTDTSEGERTRILAWGFIRGFPYRRMERKTRTQTMPSGAVVNHNPPSAYGIIKVLSNYMPEFAADISGYSVMKNSRVAQWLEDPSGAIPAPIRVKKPYIPAGKAAAE